MTPDMLESPAFVPLQWVFYRAGDRKRQRAARLVEELPLGFLKVVKHHRAAKIHLSEIEPPTPHNARLAKAEPPNGWPVHAHHWEI